MRLERPRSVGRPARISREDIADAALEIGLHAATVKTIAGRLGVDHSSLYRHVKGWDDIVFAAADRAIATLDWERETEDWRDYIHAAAEAVWELYARNPGLAEAMRTMDRTPPAGIRAFSRACRHLEAQGFGTEDAALIMDSVMDMTSDSASMWERLRRENADGTIAERLRASWQAGADDQTETHVCLMSAVIEGEPKEWWRKKLLLLIRGAAALLEARFPGSSSSQTEN
ncbi:TetR/AcrR family transcriptional regulator [Martelella soudanensis]|uniref:TetR/AcrR family transcriptional regulator n=1 Tax=unclassified Martelella TaxID=2629616 RepID=UPI0015DFEBC1|nr:MULTISPECIES: TetR/AcrR family transcriptional regulator [unclassified Martelella]